MHSPGPKLKLFIWIHWTEKAAFRRVRGAQAALTVGASGVCFETTPQNIMETIYFIGQSCGNIRLLQISFRNRADENCRQSRCQKPMDEIMILAAAETSG